MKAIFSETRTLTNKQINAYIYALNWIREDANSESKFYKQNANSYSYSVPVQFEFLTPLLHQLTIFVNCNVLSYEYVINPQNFSKYYNAWEIEAERKSYYESVYTRFCRDYPSYIEVKTGKELNYYYDVNNNTAQLQLMPFLMFTNTKRNMPIKGYVDNNENYLSSFNLNTSINAAALYFGEDVYFDNTVKTCPIDGSNLKFAKVVTSNEQYYSDGEQNTVLEPQRKNNDNANGILYTDLNLSSIFNISDEYKTVHLSALTYECRDNSQPINDIELSIFTKTDEEFLFKSSDTEISGKTYIFKYNTPNNEDYSQYELSVENTYLVKFSSGLNIKVYHGNIQDNSDILHFGNVTYPFNGYVYSPYVILYETEPHYPFNDVVLFEAEDIPGYKFKGWYTRSENFRFSPSNANDADVGKCSYQGIFSYADYDDKTTNNQKNQLKTNYNVLITENKKLFLKPFLDTKDSTSLAWCDFRYYFNSSFGVGTTAVQCWNRGPIKRSISSNKYECVYCQDDIIRQKIGYGNIYLDTHESINEQVGYQIHEKKSNKLKYPDKVLDDIAYFEGDIYKFNLLMAKYIQYRKITFEVELEDKFGVFENSSDIIKNEVPTNISTIVFEYLPVVNLDNGKHKYSAYLQVEVDADKSYTVPASYKIKVEHPHQQFSFEGWEENGKRNINLISQGKDTITVNDNAVVKSILSYNVFIPKKPGIKALYNRCYTNTNDVSNVVYYFNYYDKFCIEDSARIFKKYTESTLNDIEGFTINTAKPFGDGRFTEDREYTDQSYINFNVPYGQFHNSYNLYNRQQILLYGYGCKPIFMQDQAETYYEQYNGYAYFLNIYNTYKDYSPKKYSPSTYSLSDVCMSFYYGSFNKHTNDQQYDLLSTSTNVPCCAAMDITYDDMCATTPVSIDYDVYAHVAIYGSKDISGFIATVFNENGTQIGSRHVPITILNSDYKPYEQLDEVYKRQPYYLTCMVWSEVYKKYIRKSYYVDNYVSPDEWESYFDSYRYNTIEIPTGYKTEIVAIPHNNSKSTNATVDNPIIIDLTTVPNDEQEALALINNINLELQDSEQSYDRNAYEIAFDSLFLFQEQQKKIDAFDQIAFPVKMQQKVKYFVPYCRISCYNDLVIDLDSSSQSIDSFGMTPNNTGYLIPISGNVDYTVAYDASYSDTTKNVYEYSNISVVLFDSNKEIISDENSQIIVYNTSNECSVSFTTPQNTSYAQLLFGCKKDSESTHEFTTFSNVFFGFKNVFENCDFTNNPYQMYQPDYNGNVKAPRWYGIAQSIGSIYGQLNSLPTLSSNNELDTFQGWYNYTDNSVITDNTKFINSNMSLMSKWVQKTIDVYTQIVLNPNGGTLPQNKNAWKTVKCFDEYGQLPEPTKPNCNFIGWNLMQHNNVTHISSNTIVTNTNAHTLYAQFESITSETKQDLNILLHTLGGYLSDETSYDFIQSDGVYGITCPDLSCNIDDLPIAYRLEDPVNGKFDGLEFAGWYDKPFNGSKFEGEVLLTNDIDMYAHWKKKFVTLSFDLNDTYLQGINPIAPISVPARTYFNINSVKVPFNLGYKFDGWFNSADEKVNGKILVGKENTKFTAHWSIAGGIGDNAAQRLKIIKPFKLELNEGYLDTSYGQLTYIIGIEKILPTAEQIHHDFKTFAGWYMNNAFDGDVFTYIPSYIKQSNIKFYAKWV